MQRRCTKTNFLVLKSMDQPILRPRLHVRVEDVREELLRANIAVVLNSTPQPRCVACSGTFSDARKDVFLALSQPVQIVHKIDQQKFLAQFPREGRLDAKFKLASAQREVAVPLVIVDDGLVVKLRRADT